MTTVALHEALATLSKRAGIEVSLDGRTLEVGGARMALPEFGSPRWLEFRHAFPTTAHGDQREKLLFRIVQDARPQGEPEPRQLDADLYLDLEDYLEEVSDPAARTAIADALREKFFAKYRSAPFLLPLHASLPLAFAHSLYPGTGRPRRAARYRMFSGAVLPYLCWNGRSVDEALIAELLAIFNSEDGFTRLDQLLLAAARALTGSEGRPASAPALAARYRGDVEAAMAGGAFCQPSLAQFQHDLRAVLEMPLPRRDRIDALNLLLGLHLAVRYFRLSLVLGAELDLAVAAAGQLPDPPGARGCDCSGGLERCPLASEIRFRTGTGSYQPVSMQDPCVTAYSELSNRRLLALPVSVVTANLAQQAWQALSGPARPYPDLAGLARELRGDPAFRQRFNTLAAALAMAHLAEARPGAVRERLEDAGSIQPGLHALREVVLQSRRSRLKYTSRDVVHQLAMRDGGSFIHRNGPRVTFFEVDEDLLFLLVRLVCGTEQVPFEAFLAGLNRYGLAPQDDDERERLASALERMGMLARYSDAGEAVYVHHSL